MSKSILQKKDGTCYLCSALHGNDGYYSWIEEHHVFEGTANRRKSEHWGLKIYLCNEHHNQTNRESVHNNPFIEKLVKKMAQQEFEKKYGHEKFMSEFGKNHLDESDWQQAPKKDEPKQEKPKKIPSGFIPVADDFVPGWIDVITADASGQMVLTF